MTTEQYRILKQKAATEGFITGLLWLLSFALFVGQFAMPVLSFLGMAVAVVSAVLVITRLRQWCNVNAVDSLSFWKAFSYAFSVYLYASLIMAFGQWIYFQFVDNGYLIGQYVERLNSDEFKAIMKGVEGFNPDEIKPVIDQIAELRPIDIALQFLSSDLVISFFLSFFTALCSFKRQ